MRKEYIFIFILMFLFIFTGCSNEDIDKLNKEIEELKNSNQLKEEEIEELINSNNSKDKEIEDLKNNNQLKEEEIDSLLNSNNSKDKELEDIKKDNEEKDKLISKLEEEFEKLQEDKELKEEELNSLLNIKALDDECLNILYKMFDEGVELDEYLSFKENNIKLQEDEELKEKFDDIYYNYNKVNSMAYFKNLLQADGMTMIEEIGCRFDYYVDLNVFYDIQMDRDLFGLKNLINYRFYFFDSNEEMEEYLSKYQNIIDYNPIKGDNFFIASETLFEEGLIKKGYYKELIDYIKDLVENKKYVSGESFAKKAYFLKKENGYNYEITTGKEDPKENKAFIIGKENKVILYAIYLNEENNYERVPWCVDYRPNWAFGDGAKGYYENVYCFGKIAFYISQYQLKEYVDLYKDTYIYQTMLEDGINGLDLYMLEKSEE